MTIEQRERIRQGESGHPCSDATKAAIGRANTGHYQTPEARARMSIARRGLSAGPSHWNWRGGISSESHIIRTSTEYADWRTAVFERDNYTCQDCGQYGGDLNAHHVHEFAKYPEERFIVANGITLCVACHNKTKGREELLEA